MDNQPNGLPAPTISHGDNATPPPPAPPVPAVELDMPTRVQLPKHERRMLQLGKAHYIDPLDISAVYLERSYVVVLLKSGHKMEIGEKQLLISKEETVRAIAAEYIK